MSVNTNLLSKALKRLGILVFLFILSPISLNIGFKALNKFTEESIWIAYLIIGFSSILIILTLIFAYKTFKILLNALFNS